MLEPQWNPATEEQAMARVHRFGQQREVVTLRYLVSNSIEEVCGYDNIDGHEKGSLTCSIVCSIGQGAEGDSGRSAARWFSKCGTQRVGDELGRAIGRAITIE